MFASSLPGGSSTQVTRSPFLPPKWGFLPCRLQRRGSSWLSLSITCVRSPLGSPYRFTRRISYRRTSTTDASRTWRRAARRFASWTTPVRLSSELRGGARSLSHDGGEPFQRSAANHGAPDGCHDQRRDDV